jgi:hypothetical protein
MFGTEIEWAEGKAISKTSGRLHSTFDRLHREESSGGAVVATAAEKRKAAGVVLFRIRERRIHMFVLVDCTAAYDAPESAPSADFLLDVSRYFSCESESVG